MEQESASIVSNRSAKLLQALADFVVVVNAGSFTRAAKLSGTDKTVLSRRVRRLEEGLQTQLLHRTTRSLRVTERGQALLERVAEPLGLVLLGLAEASDVQSITGEVRVQTVSGMSGLWAQLIKLLRDRHPELSLSIATSDVTSSLVEGGFDLAVRTGHLPDSSLIARRVGDWRYVIAGSPEWNRNNPSVIEPAGLAEHWITYGNIPHADRWSFERDGVGVTVHMRPVASVENAYVIRDAVRAGVGVAAFPPFMIQEDLADGRLVKILPTWRVAHAFPIWALLPHRTFVPARVQAVLAAVEEVVEDASPAWVAISG
jgi:DNA-binding transcriptional LysR family regulator